jgi:hypothetical protein
MKARGRRWGDALYVAAAGAVELEGALGAGIGATFVGGVA